MFSPTRARAIQALSAFAAATASAVPLRSGAEELTTVRVGIVNSVTDVVFAIGDKVGYFREDGIKIEFVTFKSAADMVAPLAAGQLDVGGGSPSAGLYNAFSRGIDIRMVADKGTDPPGYGFGPFVVRTELIKNGRYKTLKDIKGMTIAVSQPGSGSFSALNHLVKKAGLQYGDVKPVSLGYPDQVVALQNGSIDGAVIIEPNATEAVKSGAGTRILDSDQFYVNQQVACVIYGSTILKAHDLGTRFMHAYIRAARYYNDALAHGRFAGPRANDVIAILTETTAIKDASVYRAIVPNGLDPNGRLNVASMREDEEFFRSLGLIQGTVRVEDVIDESYVNDALKKLGRYKRAR